MERNHKLKADMKDQDMELNQVRKENDDVDMSYKKNKWRSIMT